MKVLAIYCREDALRRKLQAAAPREYEVRAVREWTAFEALVADGAACSVVAIPRLGADPDAPRLGGLRARFPLHPVVLATRGEIDNARGLAGLPVDDVVWLGEVDRELAPTVGRTCLLAEARMFAAALRAAALPAGLRAALVRVASAEHPVRTVAALAQASGCDRRTLWNQWRQTAAHPELRLQDFLHWILLLRAAGAKTPGRSWAAVADDLGVHPHTLARLAKQLVGRSLREIAAGGQSLVAERFGQRVMSKLVRAN